MQRKPQLAKYNVKNKKFLSNIISFEKERERER
jgi:hypothetical protein